MIIDEAGLVWDRFASGYGPGGSDFVEYRCPTHPRLSWMVQRASGDASPVSTYGIDGLKQIYHTPGEALAALRANP